MDAPACVLAVKVGPVAAKVVTTSVVASHAVPITLCVGVVVAIGYTAYALAKRRNTAPPSITENASTNHLLQFRNG